jgi:ABC-type cobalamin transport system permease subunit
VHYRGSRVRPYEKKFILKFAIIGWSFIILCLTFYTMTIYFIECDFNDSTSLKAKSVMYTITISMASISYSKSSLIIYIVLLLNGEKLLDAIQDLNTKLDSIHEIREKKIGITLTIMHFCFHICFSVLYATLTIVNTSFDLQTFWYSLAFYIMELIQTSILPFIAYESLIIKNYLELLATNITVTRLAFIHHK